MFSKIVSCTSFQMLTHQVKKSQGRFTAASEYFNSLDFSLLFTMIRRQKFYGVWEIVSGELGGLFWINLYKSICTFIISVQTWNLDQSRYRSHWPVPNIIFSHGQGTQPNLKYTAVSANDLKNHLTTKLLIRASVGLALLSSYSFDTMHLFNTLIFSLLTLEGLQQRTEITSLWF